MGFPLTKNKLLYLKHLLFTVCIFIYAKKALKPVRCNDQEIPYNVGQF